MKLNKSQFKSILKECIQELLAEGAFHKVIKETVVNSAKVKPLIEASNEKPRQQQKPVPETIKQLTEQTSQLISDPGLQNVFQKIFEDTAQTTVRAQALGEQHKNVNPMMLMENNVEDVDLEQLKPEGQELSRWASLAFNKK